MVLSVILGLAAGAILLFYSGYFVKIIKGAPQNFELQLLQVIANWMVEKGQATRGQLWLVLLFSALLEAIYFLLVFSVIDNLFLLMFTGFFIAVEVFHLLSFGFSLNRFFKGETKLKHLFNWRVERLSALLFFTHALLMLVAIIWY